MFDLFTSKSRKQHVPIPESTPRIRHCHLDRQNPYRKVDEIWQYRTGRSLATFDKDHSTTEEGLQVRQKQSSCSQAYGFATITMYMYSWWRSDARAEIKILQRSLWKLVVHITEVIFSQKVASASFDVWSYFRLLQR